MLHFIVDLFFILYPAPYQRPTVSACGRAADAIEIRHAPIWEPEG
jgi:hypothetical protein